MAAIFSLERAMPAILFQPIAAMGRSYIFAGKADSHSKARSYTKSRKLM